jgi:hypothetical protein
MSQFAQLCNWQKALICLHLTGKCINGFVICEISFLYNELGGQFSLSVQYKMLLNKTYPTLEMTCIYLQSFIYGTDSYN